MECTEIIHSGNDQEFLPEVKEKPDEIQDFISNQDQEFLPEDKEKNDEIGIVLSEWKNHSEFNVRKFYLWLFPALFSVYSLVVHTFLGAKYLNEPLILQSDNFTTDNFTTCRNLSLTVEVSNHSDYWTDKRFYANNLYTCETQNLVFGIATLSIEFLPGIQWYTTLQVNENHRLGRFLSSLLFPFFSILFKIARCTHQGPATAKMYRKVTSCQTVLKTMVQLLLQVVIILWSRGIANVSDVQYLVLATNLLKAAYEKAEENARVKAEEKARKEQEDRASWRRTSTLTTATLARDSSWKARDHQVISPPWKETAKWIPLYLFLTIFRVLSISFVIVVLPFIWIPIYSFFAFVIICIGYIWTKREGDFITRGLKSAFTSVDYRFKAEWIFHTYWFVVNLFLLTLSGYKAFVYIPQSGVLVSGPLVSGVVTRNPLVFKIVLIVCMQVKSKSLGLAWFLTGLFFPFYALTSRMVALWRAVKNDDTDEIRRLNVLMNGPRVIWGRMPTLSLSLFILFTDRFDTYEQDSTPIPGAISYFVDKLICDPISHHIESCHSVLTNFYYQMVVLLFIDGLRASWMMSEQMVLWDHKRNADGKTPNLSPFESWKREAKLFPYAFLCCAFRGLSFALIVSMLRYWSILLYIVLILGSICLGGFFNQEDQNFVTRGVKSVLSIVDDRNDFKHESVFQIYWAVCNCLIVGILTALVKLPQILASAKVKWLLNLRNQLDQLFIVNHPSPFFTATVCSIFATGILSLLAHFLLMNPQSDDQSRPAPKSKDEQIEMHEMNAD